MKTISVYKRGYDYHFTEDSVTVPYPTKKFELVEYIKDVFGPDAFRKYQFVMVTRAGSRWGAYRQTR